jgi:hypothetical protein
MQVQTKQRSIVFALMITLFALSIGSSAQTKSRGFSPTRMAQIVSFPSSGRKVAEELNPQPLPPCEKCAAAPMVRPHGDPTTGMRLRHLTPIH